MTRKLWAGLAFAALVTATPSVARSPKPTAKGWQRDERNPVLTPDQVSPRPGAFYPMVGDPAVLFDEGKFKMWFSYGGLDAVSDEGSFRVRVGYAESQDGCSFKVVSAPALEVGEGEAWDLTNSESASVLKDAELPEGHPRKYRMYYAGLDAARERLGFDELLKLGMSSGIGLAFSADGKKFARLPAAESPYKEEGLVLKPNPPVLDKDVSDFIHVSDPEVVRVQGVYHLWYTSFVREAKGAKTYFAIGYAASTDGITWTKHGLVLKPEALWELRRSEPHLGRPAVVWTGERFEMFYDVRTDDDNPLATTASGIGFAWSENGRDWDRAPQPVFRTDNGPGEKQGILTGAAALIRDNNYYLFYAGADSSWDRFVLNLATRAAPMK